MSYYELTVIPPCPDVEKHINEVYFIYFGPNEDWEEVDDDMIDVSKEFPGHLLVVESCEDLDSEYPNDWRTCYLNGEIVDEWSNVRPSIPQHLIDLVEPKS